MVKWFGGTLLLTVGLYLVALVVGLEDSLHLGALLIVVALLLIGVGVVTFVAACIRAPIQFEREKDEEFRRYKEAAFEALTRQNAIRRRFGSNIEPRPPPDHAE